MLDEKFNKAAAILEVVSTLVALRDIDAVLTAMMEFSGSNN
jgi:hypothetical protein